MAISLNKSVLNSILCLQHLAASQGAVGVREMARLLELDTAKVSRLLKTLETVGLTQQDAQRKYSVGPGIQVLAALSIHSSPFYRAAIEAVENVAHERFVIALGVLWQGRVVYLIHAKPGRAAAQSLGAYEVIPADQSIIGISLLARQTDDVITRMIGEERFQAVADDIAQARAKTVFTKIYPDGEARMAVCLQEHNASIAFSRIEGVADGELDEYKKKIVHLAKAIRQRVNQFKNDAG